MCLQFGWAATTTLPTGLPGTPPALAPRGSSRTRSITAGDGDEPTGSLVALPMVAMTRSSLGEVDSGCFFAAGGIHRWPGEVTGRLGSDTPRTGSQCLTAPGAVVLVKLVQTYRPSRPTSPDVASLSSAAVVVVVVRGVTVSVVEVVHVVAVWHGHVAASVPVDMVVARMFGVGQRELLIPGGSTGPAPRRLFPIPTRTPVADRADEHPTAHLPVAVPMVRYRRLLAGQVPGGVCRRDVVPPSRRPVTSEQPGGGCA